MFCQNCGNEMRTDLNFCNRCGARVPNDADKSESLVRIEKNVELAQNLGYAVGFSGFAGIVSLAVIIYNLINRSYIPNGVIPMVLFFAALVFGIIFLLVRQISILSQTNRAAPPISQRELANELIRPESLPPANTNPLDAFRASAASVTEHTTRSFEKIPIEKQ